MANKQTLNPACGYDEDDLEVVSDNPPLTDAELASARPFAEVFPEIAKTFGRRGKQKAPTKELISIRLASSTLAAFRAQGPGWQKRIGEVLDKAARSFSKS